nr:hypothetical protein [Tanacetum cinerariifolium]
STNLPTTTSKHNNDDHSGQFGNQRTVNVAAARENVGSKVVQQSGIQCFNCKEYGHFAKECRKPKRVKDSTYHKEKMLLCKQAEQGVPLQAEQYDWLAKTDEEVDEQELEAHYSYMDKIQEVPTADLGTDSEPVEQVNVQFIQQLQPEWSRFLTIVKQQHKLYEVSYHKLFDILNQYQNEVNDLCDEKLARNANPLALVATAQASQDPYYQTPRFHISSAPSPKPSIPSRSHTATRHKGKEIAKPITPPSKTAILNKIRGTRTCKRIWFSLQSTSRRSKNLPTTTSKHPQTPRTRMWIRLHGTTMMIILDSLGIRGR